MPEDPIDRYARGELSAAEARELALRSLDDPELFDELSAIGVSKAVVETRVPTAPVRGMRRVAIWVAVAAGLAGVAVYGLRTNRAAAPAARPPLASMLLAGELQAHDTTVFRGSKAESREPRIAGKIIALADGMATIDLGAIDGLGKGDDLQIAGGGRLMVETVFRDRAQGRVSGLGKIGDMVRVSAGARLRALSDQTDARYAAGDLAGARSAADRAVQIAEGANLPERPVAWNRLAVLLTLNGEYDAAGGLLQRALAVLSKSDPAYAECANNLGVLAEVANDRRSAATRYADALEAAAGLPEPEKRVIESNLLRTRGSP
jgi:tetratricopeptide (TPR) repeat protein